VEKGRRRKKRRSRLERHIAANNSLDYSPLVSIYIVDVHCLVIDPGITSWPNLEPKFSSPILQCICLTSSPSSQKSISYFSTTAQPSSFSTFGPSHPSSPSQSTSPTPLPTPFVPSSSSPSHNRPHRGYSAA
jgi:hypothetical protein